MATAVIPGSINENMQPPEHRKIVRGMKEETWEWEEITPQEMLTWNEPPIGRGALHDMKKNITLIWRITTKSRMPWVMVAESACLRKIEGTPRAHAPQPT